MTEQIIKIKDININYKRFGENHSASRATSAEIFLILHGWGGSSSSWLKVCEILKTDCEIYAVDFPFFGKSGNLKEPWKIDDYVEMVEEFVKVKNLAPPQINIIAHSFGGRVAIKLAVKNPAWLKKLYLCDAAGIAHPPTIKQKIAGIVAKAGKKIKNFTNDIISRVLRHPERRRSEGSPCRTVSRGILRPPGARAQNDAKILKLFYRIFGASDYYNCKNEIMRQTFRNIIAEDLTPYLSKIKIPTTIIWGEKDKYTPLADGILMNKEIKKSKLHIIKNAGHGIHIHESEKVAEIIYKEQAL